MYVCECVKLLYARDEYCVDIYVTCIKAIIDDVPHVLPGKDDWSYLIHFHGVQLAYQVTGDLPYYIPNVIVPHYTLILNV